MKNLLVFCSLGALSFASFVAWTSKAYGASIISAPVSSVAAEAALGLNFVPVKLDWTPSSGGSEFMRYELQQSVNDRPFTAVDLTDKKNTFQIMNLVLNAAYKFRVRGFSANVTASEWVEGPVFRPVIDSESAATVHYIGAWVRVPAGAPRNWGAADKFARIASVVGAAATYTFSSPAVAWVASTGPTKGLADVFIDGTKAATVDLFSADSQFGRIVFASGQLKTGVEHKLEIKVRSEQVEVFGFVHLN